MFSFGVNSCISVNIVKEGSGRIVTVALMVSRFVTRSMRRPRDACPMEELVSTLGAGHCIRLGFVTSTVQGWEGKKERGEEGKRGREEGSRGEGTVYACIPQHRHCKN